MTTSWKTELDAATSIGQAVAVLGSFGGKLEATNRRLAEYLTVTIEEQFAARTDPYGQPWASGPSYNGLFDSGDMLGSLGVMVNGLEIELTMDAPSHFHQSGTRKMPRRQIFPDEGEDAPHSYEADFQKAVDELLGP